MKNLIYIITLSTFVIFGQATQAQTPEKASIAFYNLENLFDTIDSPIEGDFEWTPGGEKIWNTERYNLKLDNLAFVISNLDGNADEFGPDILGVCEVENRSVLEDLIKHEVVKKSDYGIVHYESPDHRGIDVGFLYRKSAFEVQNSRTATLTFKNEDYNTRDQLVVSGLLYGELIHVIVNHWPSRMGGPEKSDFRRVHAAKLTKTIIDSIYAVDKKAKIVIMGDFNDDPSNKSIAEVLGAKGEQKGLKKGGFFNPMVNLLTPTRGTLCYKNEWFLFDQILFSSYWFNSKGLNFSQADIFDNEKVKVESGKYQGHPLRTHAGKYYLKGYSDHFGVYSVVTK